MRRADGAVVISAAAKCPTRAPRRDRCSPNSDIMFTVASIAAGAAST